MDSKLCSACQTTKPVADFYLNSARADGLSVYCVSCQRSFDSARRIRSRRQLVADLGGRCERCGFDDWRALQVDHVNGNGRAERDLLTAAGFHRRIRENRADYALLCANCNQIKRMEQAEHIGRRVFVRTEPTERKKGKGRSNPTTNAERSRANKTWAAEHPTEVRERAARLSRSTVGRRLVTGVDGKRHWQYP